MPGCEVRYGIETMTTALPSCFSQSPRGVDYTDGAWHSLPPGSHPYKINGSFWETLGTSIRRTAPQHYGRCDEANRNRTLYQWTPHRCTLHSFDMPRACKLLRGRSVVMVGDSTVFQAFLSFALLMHARLGKNPKRASTVSEMTASACGDSTRLAFVRSDLLLHTNIGGDFRAVQRCDGFTNLQVR